MSDVIPRSIWLIVLILAGALFAGAETAYSYTNGVRIRLLAEENDKKAKHVVKILDHFDMTIVTLLIVVNIIHIVASTIATSLFIDITKSTALGSLLATIILTLAIFIFSETIPKNIARTNADATGLSIGGFIRFLSIILYPFAILLTLIGNCIKKIFRLEDNEPTVTEDEFSAMVEDASDDEVFEPEEKEIIQSAIEFGDITVSDIMTPKDQVMAISVKAELEEIKDTLIHEKYSRFPVYRGNLNTVIGVIRSTNALWEIINHPDDFKIREVMTKPVFCMPNEEVAEVFERMCNRKNHFAIVQENHKTLGIITMEDILEEIVGEIYDEDEPATEQEGLS